MDKKNLALIAIVALVVVGMSFYGGIQYAQSKGVAVNQNPGRAGNFGGGQGGARSTAEFAARTGAGAGTSGFVSGEIIAKDDQSLTVKLQDGGSKIVILSTTTPVSKTTVGLSKDLIVGEKVTINGQTNKDGSVNAQMIRIESAPLQ